MTTIPAAEASKGEPREAKQTSAEKPYFQHPEGIVSFQEFQNYSSIAFSTGYLEAIEGTDDPEDTAEFAEAAAHWAKNATDPRARSSRPHARRPYGPNSARSRPN